MESELTYTLKKYFGYDTFRPMQEDIINSVIENKDVLVLMPTGGGKSICYQLPSLIKEGLAIVISPLIALMKDQVESLNANGISASFLNSTLTNEEQNEIQNNCIDGKIKLLYISPEKLFSAGFIEFLKILNISMFAIDEAHCISFWGHDFRPEYTKLYLIKEYFPNIPIIALTATADILTRKDIIKQLKLDTPKIFISSFDRPNLTLTVLPADRRIDKIMDFLSFHKNEPGIIYCLSRNSTENITERLKKKGYKTAFYHAGMENEERSLVQSKFLKDDIQIICATVAFGMGINKTNVRWVIHYNMPKNIESYYQEIGRCGRDGINADTLLFYSYSDIMLQKEMLNDLTEQRRELQLAKLERLQQYAEANICRRKILLNYFSENIEIDCGNCDVCLNPREEVDGSLNAQKILSAIARTKESVTVNTLINILRGSHDKTILEKNYHIIKTYGVGRDISYVDWREFIHQMLNCGFVDISYDKGNILRLNERSRDILFNNKKVSFFKPKYNYIELKKKKTTISKTEFIKNELFEKLRVLRKNIADREGKAPFIIFHDTTLMELSLKKPRTEIEMLNISGISISKFEKYGKEFLSAIKDFMKEEYSKGSRIKGMTQVITFDLYKQGLDPEEIAEKRNLNINTIYSHLADLVLQGYEINIGDFVKDNELKDIQMAIDIKGTLKLKEIYDFLDKKYDFGKIRIVIAFSQLGIMNY